jgi:hypothetical protein
MKVARSGAMAAPPCIQKVIRRQGALSELETCLTQREVGE